MKKYRLNTTISFKHHGILRKHVEKFGTQQNVLEQALESLDKNLNQNTNLTPDDELWLWIGRETRDIICVLQKDFFKILLETADFNHIKEYVNNYKPMEFIIEWYYQKPLKECSLQEIIDALLLNIKIRGGIDTINCTEDDECHYINMTHSLGINCSKLSELIEGDVFNSFGAKYEIHISERSIFFKVFK